MKKYYSNFIDEAEMFFVSKFISSKSIEEKFTFCLDVIYNIEKKISIDYTKGIIAYNPKYGQGKSFFFDVVHHRHKRRFNKNVFVKTSAKDLVKLFKNEGEQALLDFISVKNLYIDDIGDEGEEKMASHYNNKLNVLRYVLLKRYDMWIENKGQWKLFGTTNLSIQDFAKVYDGRVSDRLLQMVYFEEFDFLNSGSFRQVKETRLLTAEEVKANWQKLYQQNTQEKAVEIDMVQYMNDLLTEKQDYIDTIDEMRWTMIKDFLISKGHVTESDFDFIDENVIDSARLIERQSKREQVRVLYKHATASVRNKMQEEAYKTITRKRVIELAQNTAVKKVFNQLRKQPDFKFE